MTNSQVFSASVKQVLSGDTVVLYGNLRPDGPPAERSLSLAFVSSPRMLKDNWENLAFEARERLRKLTVGKSVGFQVLYTIKEAKTGNDREFGRILLQDGSDVAESLLKDGLLRIRANSSAKEEHDDYLVHLERIETEAKQTRVGTWGAAASEALSPVFEKEASIVFEKFKNSSVSCVVEQVQSGDSIILGTKGCNGDYLRFRAVVYGVRVCETRSEQPTVLEQQAKFFVESRLLQREVTCQFLGVSGNNSHNLTARIIHPAGDISVFLLKAGLAKIDDYQSSIIGPKMMKELRDAESSAKQKGVGIWKLQALNSKLSVSANEFLGTIVRVINSDLFEVQNKNSDVITRVNLCSLRGPRSSRPEQAAWTAEAKEHCRPKYIGKAVKVTIESHAAETAEFPARTYVTLSIKGKNIAKDIVESGFASVVRRHYDEEARSPAYDDLSALEIEAQNAGIGMWSSKRLEPLKLANASESAARAKQFLAGFQRIGRIHGVVDFVLSPSRLKIQVPKENISLTFILEGLSVPRISKTGSSEPFADEAMKYATTRFTQRDVEMTFKNIDRNGNFVGSLFVNKNINVASLLLSQGLASIYSFKENAPIDEGLQGAEDEARQAKKGIWSLEPKEVVQVVPQAHIEGKFSAKIVDVSANGSVTLLKSTKDDTSDISDDIRRVFASMESLRRFPRIGELIAVFDFAGNMYVRARVTDVDKSAKTVSSVGADDGIARNHNITDLKALPAHLLTRETKAMLGQLSFIKFPSSQFSYGTDVCNYILSKYRGIDLEAKLNHESTGTVAELELIITSNDQSLNDELVAEGLCYVDPHLLKSAASNSEQVKELYRLQKAALSKHIGIWRYGDFTEDA